MPPAIDAGAVATCAPIGRSRAAEAELSVANGGEWSSTQRWDDRVHDDDGIPVYTSYIGDADVLANGNVLITHGGIGAQPPDPADPRHALTIEVAPSVESGGEIVWQLRSDPRSPNTSYRGERIESCYVGPDWTPRP